MKGRLRTTELEQEVVASEVSVGHVLYYKPGCMLCLGIAAGVRFLRVMNHTAAALAGRPERAVDLAVVPMDWEMYMAYRKPVLQTASGEQFVGFRQVAEATLRVLLWPQSQPM